jgi:DNA replication protein DnaC
MAQADCSVCSGSGWKIVDRPPREGAAPVPVSARANSLEGQLKSVWAVPCDCTAGDRSESALSRARVPERYRHCDFANYETDNEIEGPSRAELESWNRSLTQAKLVVERFAQEFSPIREMQSEQGLLLMGPCGVGKTHLVAAALKEIVLRSHSGLFYDYRELLKEIQDSYNPENQSTEMGVLEPVLKADVLVLDDLGSSKPSPWALETVGYILNSRYNEKRVTLLTTNYLDADSAAAAPNSPRMAGMRAPVLEDSLTDRVGKRIRSRLYEMCRTLEIYAPDYRKEIRNVSRFRA